MDTLKNKNDEGKFRDNNEIVVGDSIDAGKIFHTPPDYKKLQFLIEEFCKFANNDTDEFIHPIIKGIILHFLIGYIHPFNDGNGRTARLLADFIFRKARLPYIRDWGAVGDEYKKMIHRSLKESDLKYQKLFLAQRLLARLKGIENLFSSNLSSNQEIKDYMRQRRI